MTGSGASFVVRYRIESLGRCYGSKLSCIAEPCLFRLAAAEEASLASQHSRLLQLGYPQACMSDDNRDLQRPENRQCTSRRGDRVTLNPEGQPPTQPPLALDADWSLRLQVLGLGALRGRQKQTKL